jgi:hypothetical protein
MQEDIASIPPGRATALRSWISRLMGVALLLGFQGSWTGFGISRATFPALTLPLFSLDAGGAATTEPAPLLAHLYRIPVIVTGYSSTPEETDEDPFVTASNKMVQRGYIALSRDLLRPYTPGAPFTFGDQVEVLGVGVFQVEDTMNPRYRMRADIWFEDKERALAWGSRELILGRLVAGHRSEVAETPRTPGLRFHPAPADRGTGPQGPGV